MAGRLALAEVWLAATAASQLVSRRMGIDEFELKMPLKMPFSAFEKRDEKPVEISVPVTLSKS